MFCLKFVQLLVDTYVTKSSVSVFISTNSKEMNTYSCTCILYVEPWHIYGHTGSGKSSGS